MLDTAKEVCRRVSRCSELEGRINKTTAMPDMPKPNKRSWKDEGRTHRAPKSKEKAERKKKGRRQSHCYSSNLVSDRGHEHGFEGVRMVVTISGRIMRFWFAEGWAALLFPMSDWFWWSIYQHVQNAGRALLFMDNYKSSFSVQLCSVQCSTRAPQCLSSRFQRHKALWKSVVLN